MKNVLFVCTHNAGRSQMAEAFFNRHAPDDVRAESAGAQPALARWPVVVRAMEEVGIDLSRVKPKRLLPEMQLHADSAVTLACGSECPYVPGVVEDWDISDPAGRPIAEVSAIRDEIERRVVDLHEYRLEEIRSDRTAHQRRLVGLLRSLGDDFAKDHSEAEVHACAEAILARYDDARIRSYVLVLAERETRECLAGETCHALAAVR